MRTRKCNTKNTITTVRIPTFWDQLKIYINTVILSFQNQWDINGGRCGTCGDPFQGPRAHEAGGRFARYDRPVSQCYNKNDKIDVNIRITAYHRGTKHTYGGVIQEIVVKAG